MGEWIWDRSNGTIINYGFEQLNLHRIELEVFDFNTRARKSYEKLGFKQEGIRREVLFYDGEYHHAIMMSILKDEYLKRN
ncbi:GNAT family N-acetyltransferase [Virgibacillus sp. Bac330]|uniref:GNAT family N-acetyltransferase n=1 Tax=Virgibacillus sp. Bac330 TaxID=2419841 RepID=UPI00352AE9BC